MFWFFLRIHTSKISIKALKIKIEDLNLWLGVLTLET